MPAISCRTLATGGAARTSAGAVSAGVTARLVRSAATMKPIPLTKSRTLIRNSVSRSRIGSLLHRRVQAAFALRATVPQGEPGLRKTAQYLRKNALYGGTAVLEIERRYH